MSACTAFQPRIARIRGPVFPSQPYLQRRRVACAALAPEFKEAVDTYVEENTVLVFIKGSKDFPQCGFSNTVVQVFKQMEVPFEAIDILSNEMLRSGMKEYSQWPTFPQVYIGGEFYGGCDILLESFKDGTLKEELERVMLE